MKTDALLKWSEIDFTKLKKNYFAIQSILPEHTKILAVLKDDAYSHGDAAIAHELVQHGIDYLAVSTIDEGIRLRKNQINCPILILSYTVPARFDELIQYNLTQTIFSSSYGICLENYLSDTNQTLEAHLMIDTGMHREGILYDESEQSLKTIVDFYHAEHIHVTGIYTHFSVADSRNIDDIQYTHRQHDLFQTLLMELRQQGCPIGITHAQNTPGVLQYPEFHYDYVRIGTLLLGLPYGDISKLPIASIVSPIYSLKAKIFQVKKLPNDKSISYGKNYTTKTPCRIAILSLGYGDGYPRMLSQQNAVVQVHGQYAPVIGDICMDQLIIDVSNIQNVKEGDIVTLITDKDTQSPLSLDMLATSTNCLKHELMTKIGPRVQRVYLTSKE